MERIYKKRGRKRNYIVPDEEKMTFRGYYFSLSEKLESQKTRFIQEIADLCVVSDKTVRCWIAGVYRPDAVKRKLIADKLGVNPDNLFPDEVRDIHNA